MLIHFTILLHYTNFTVYRFVPDLIFPSQTIVDGNPVLCEAACSVIILFCNSHTVPRVFQDCYLSIASTHLHCHYILRWLTWSFQRDTPSTLNKCHFTGKALIDYLLCPFPIHLIKLFKTVHLTDIGVTIATRQQYHTFYISPIFLLKIYK